MFAYFIVTIILSVCRVCFTTLTYNFTIYGEDQHGYYITVLLGTPPQKLNLLLDTGSSNIAVAAVPTPQHPKYFHYNESQSLRELDIAVDLRYVVGQWSGFLAKDVLHFKNEEIESTVACMTSIDKIFDDASRYQGLLGLAYPFIAIPDLSAHPFMNTLTTAQNISDIFALDLCGPYFTSKEQYTQCGQLHIGHISDAYNPHEIVYTPIYKEWYYEVILTDFRVGMNHAPVHCSELNKGRSIIDSGTTEMCLPQNVYDWTLKQIKSHLRIVPSKFWINDTAACVPASLLHLDAFPSVTVSLYHTANSSFNLVISPELYLLPMKAPNLDVTCFKLAFASSSEGVFIGSSILKGFYVIFDRQGKRIGFANSSNLIDNMGFSGFVIKPKRATKNTGRCKMEQVNNSSEMSPLLIILLISSLLAAIVLLYMLVSWIFRHFTSQADDSSDTDSLVCEDEFL